MRKIILLLVLFTAALGSQASVMDATASYIYSSDYNQARAGAALPIGTTASIGLEAKYVEDKLEDGLKDPVYSIYMPISVDLEIAKINLVPFYYFKNKSHQLSKQDPSAFGISSQLVMNLVDDEVAELYTQGYIGVSFARQKGTVQQEDHLINRYYDQLAYTLGVRQNFYGAFGFQIAGTAYQYPDGISNVDNFYGILDQKDLAFTQSYDVSRALGKYALSARFTRFWADKHSSLYVGYHYMELYTADPQHSALVGNTFPITQQIHVDMAYNHICTVHNKNKRDLFYINVNVSF